MTTQPAMSAAARHAAERAAERIEKSEKWWARVCKINDVPLKVAVEEQLREAAGLWILLGTELTRKPRPSRSPRVTTSEQPAAPAPGDVDVVDARHRVESFAAEYASVLVNSSAWKQGVLDGTLEQLAAMADRAGHFTEHPSPHLRGEFLADLLQVVIGARHVFDRDPRQWNPIDVGCFEKGCDGVYEIEIPYADEALTEAERKRAFKDSRPQARCSKNHEHTIDARLAHHSAFEAMQ